MRANEQDNSSLPPTMNMVLDKIQTGVDILSGKPFSRRDLLKGAGVVSAIAGSGTIAVKLIEYVGHAIDEARKDEAINHLKVVPERLGKDWGFDTRTDGYREILKVDGNPSTVALHKNKDPNSPIIWEAVLSAYKSPLLAIIRDGSHGFNDEQAKLLRETIAAINNIDPDAMVSAANMGLSVLGRWDKSKETGMPKEAGGATPKIEKSGLCTVSIADVEFSPLNIPPVPGTRDQIKGNLTLALLREPYFFREWIEMDGFDNNGYIKRPTAEVGQGKDAYFEIYPSNQVKRWLEQNSGKISTSPNKNIFATAEWENDQNLNIFRNKAPDRTGATNTPNTSKP